MLLHVCLHEPHLQPFPIAFASHALSGKKGNSEQAIQIACQGMVP